MTTFSATNHQCRQSRHASSDILAGEQLSGDCCEFQELRNGHRLGSIQGAMRMRYSQGAKASAGFDMFLEVVQDRLPPFALLLDGVLGFCVERAAHSHAIRAV